jgi:lysozyme family protein
MPDVTLPAPGFPRALALVLGFEGGKSDKPSDPGGRTAYGITHDTFDAYCDAHRQPRRDVFTITQAEVADVYHEKYWEAGSCDEIPWPLSLVHFDARVNHGPAHARRFLMAARLDSGDAVAEAKRYLDLRATFYRQIVAQNPGQERFFNGWMNRLDRLRKEVAA